MLREQRCLLHRDRGPVKVPLRAVAMHLTQRRGLLGSLHALRGNLQPEAMREANDAANQRR